MGSRIAAIVLAAGTSSRFGQNKLLQPIGDTTVIGMSAGHAAAAGLSPLIVVTGHDRERIEAALAPLRSQLTFAHNPNFETGEMSSSLKVGLGAVADAHDVEAAFVILGDMPLVPASVFGELIQPFVQARSGIVIPTYGGKRGHPVLFARELWPDLLALGANESPRDVLQRRSDRITQVEVATDAIFVDVDTPERYQAALERLKAGASASSADAG